MRRTVELFNISFLDLLSGALGAVIFLFLIVPKGEGLGPTNDPQLAIVFDTIQNKFYGDLPDSLNYKRIGDSLLTVVVEFDRMPGTKSTPKERLAAPTKKPAPTPKKEVVRSTPTTAKPARYTGSMPDVPCVFSIELKWDDPADNVDLFVCKDNDCVFGGRRYRNFIGYWDSGKSRSSIFGGDLRTSQEAVRQFDDIIPGQYTIFAQYKEALSPKNNLAIRGLVYTKNPDGDERGKPFNFNLSMDPKNRTRIGVLTVDTDGSFDLQLFK